jgi:uncharacterized protein YbgA (DUF1722 family)/uncharacterized protein YbbK (DUF523 family)
MPLTSVQPNNTPIVGIGSCLAGNPVRFNGSSKAANAHVQKICEHVTMRVFCPEMGIGLGTPRPPIHLVGSAEVVRVLDVQTHLHDFSEPIKQFASNTLEDNPELCGYILVKGSPSCGYDRVKRFSPEGNLLASDQRGIFAAALAEFDPLLPLEDDGRLNDPGLRNSFIARIHAYHDWKTLCAQNISPRQLIAFYTRYKYLVMAHHLPSYKSIGRLLANTKGVPIETLAEELITQLMTALTHVCTTRTNTNVLQHIAGYLKRKLSSDHRQRLAGLIHEYRLGKIPLIVPVTLLKHHLADHPDPYLEQQVFLSSKADDMSLRNSL